MTNWGAWSYAGGNGFRIGYDIWYTSGNVVNVAVYIQNQYNVSGDAIVISYSGTWSGSQTPTLTASSGGTTLILAVVPGSQAYNTTATLNFAVTGLYNGSAPTVTAVTTLGPLAPAAPTGLTATRVSDAQTNLAWTDNPTPSAPYDSLNVWRLDNTAANAVVGSPAGTASSFSDTGLSADRKYRYYVDAVNSAGSTSSAIAGPVYTTPADPTGCTATKTGGGDITVTWTNTSTYAADTPVEVRHAANGVWDGAPLATIAAGAAATYTHPAPNTSQTHQYRVRAKITFGTGPTTLYSGYSTSLVVQLLARPNAPTGLTVSSPQQSGSNVDAAYITTLGWTHNPIDASAQTAREVQHQYSTDGGATWSSMVSTGKITSSASSWAAPVNTWANNRMVRWQVRTWGAYAGTAPTYSNWSALATFCTSTTPTAALTGSSTCTTSVLTATGGYFDAEGSSQTGARWSLRLGAVTLEMVTLGPADSARFLTYTFATPVQDATSYVVAYQTQDSAGLWSAEATKTIAVSYAKPATPSLSVTYSDATGAVSGTVTNPTPGAEPAAAFNVIYRNGVPLLALSSVAVNGSFTDPVPPLNADVAYSVVAVSALPSVSVISAAQHVNTTSAKAWVNGGAGLSLAVAILTEPKVSTEEGLERASRKYSGRTTEVLYDGVAKAFTGTLTGHAPVADLDALAAIVNAKGVGCYRDPDGRRRFVRWGLLRQDRGAGTTARKPFTLPFSEVDYGE